jgi:hypothetical protein
MSPSSSMTGKLSNGSKEIFEGEWNDCYFPYHPVSMLVLLFMLPPLLIITIGVLSNILVDCWNITRRPRHIVVQLPPICEYPRLLFILHILLNDSPSFLRYCSPYFTDVSCCQTAPLFFCFPAAPLFNFALTSHSVIRPTGPSEGLFPHTLVACHAFTATTTSHRQ